MVADDDTSRDGSRKDSDPGPTVDGCERFPDHTRRDSGQHLTALQPLAKRAPDFGLVHPRTGFSSTPPRDYKRALSVIPDGSARQLAGELLSSCVSSFS
jgi:hypothetical protein